MKSVTRILLLGLFLANGHVLFGQTTSIDAHITVLSSPDAPGVLTKERVGSCLQQLLWQWKLSDKELPNIVVYHITKRAAAMVHVRDVVAVRKNVRPPEAEAYFEIWIVGEPSTRAIVIGLENLLEAHFGLSVSEDERKQVMTRVHRMQSSTIDVAEGK